ncbi:MAG TPA: Lrp/AsnC ligand binding domain-containing protein [Nitrosopumilaceae archaeon]|nr:Lrp/AsnC ligand binding domain-containing protein [Nitrosopumilaceae archaeon]
MHNTCEIQTPHEMATAHIILRCKSGFEKRVIENLEKIDGVTNIHRTVGQFDILAKVEATDHESLRKIIRWKIFKSDYIESITTLMCVRKSLCVVVS